MHTTGTAKYYAAQLEGRPEDDLSARWSVVDGATGRTVVSWRDTPLTGMTQQDAEETAAAWNTLEGR
jgi:hypothetical protein